MVTEVSQHDALHPTTEHSADMSRAVFVAQQLIDQAVKPKGFKYTILQKLKTIQQKRAATYFAVFDPSEMDFVRFYHLREDKRFLYAQLLPVFDIKDQTGEFPDTINDYNEVLAVWYDQYQAAAIPKAELVAFLKTVDAVVEPVPKLKEVLEKDRQYMAMTLSKANALGVSQHEYLKSDEAVAFKKELDAQPGAVEAYKEWEDNTFQKRLHALQKRVMEYLTDEAYLIQDTITFYDDGFDTEFTIDRPAYKTFIAKHGTKQEKSRLVYLNDREKTLRDRAMTMDEYLVHKSERYTHVVARKDIRVPVGYTGDMYVVGLKLVSGDKPYVAQRYSFVDGQPEKDAEQLVSNVADLGVFLADADGVPLILVETGDLREELALDDADNPSEFLEEDGFSFDDAMDEFWDQYWVLQNIEDEDDDR